MDTKAKKALLSEIIECKGNVDLVVYCANMTQTRYTKGEEETIADRTGALGAEIWNKALFALTFANALHLPASETCSIEEYLAKKHKDWIKNYMVVWRQQTLELPMYLLLLWAIQSFHYQQQWQVKAGS